MSICAGSATYATQYGLSDIARHVIQHTLNPRLESLMAPYDVAWRSHPNTLNPCIKKVDVLKLLGLPTMTAMLRQKRLR